MDQSKKTMRHFYCRDVLWETFEQMANDFDCSIDYLVNEAMRYYARSKNYQSPNATGGAPGSEARTNAMPAAGGAFPAGSSAAAMPPGVTARRGAPPPLPAGGRREASMPASSAQDLRRAAAPAGGSAALPAMQPPRRPAPPVQRPTPDAAPTLAPAPTLFLVFNNERVSIDKDQFIIGRGSKTSDLAIKDGNISRKHAAVIRRNGTYYIKDLGSTNGIDYKGMRIDNKRIDEGDVFHLCDYELRFTYRG